MKRKRLILGGLIFVLLFSLLPIARARAEDPNLTGTWNGKHGTPVAGWDWDGDYGVRISIVDSNKATIQEPVDFIQDLEAGNVVDAWFANSAFDAPAKKKNKLQYKNGGGVLLHSEKRMQVVTKTIPSYTFLTYPVLLEQKARRLISRQLGITLEMMIV